MKQVDKVLFNKLNDIINKIYFKKYKVTYKAAEDIFISQYKGSAFRGWLFDAYRRKHCVPFFKAGCDKCPDVQECQCGLLFKAPLQEGVLSGKYTYPPRPYILLPVSNNEKIIRKGEKFGFELTLIGDGQKFYDSLYDTFEVMGQIGLGSARSKSSFQGVEIFDSKKVSSGLNNGLSIKNDQVTLRFVTPIRIQTVTGPDGKKRSFEEQIPSFQTLLESMAPRFAVLGHLYCGTEWIDTSFVSELTKDIKTVSHSLDRCDWLRYSGSQKKFMRFDGYIGNITYQGDIEKWLSLLALGSELHIGSVATFGLGKYIICNESVTL